MAGARAAMRGHATMLNRVGGTLLARVVRYGVAGLLATVLYAGAVAVLVELGHVAAVPATGIATVLVIITSYIVNRVWVFDTNRSHTSALSRFMIASLAGLTLNTGLMYLAVHRLGWRYVGGLALATIIVPPTNFLINYLWVFRQADGRTQRLRTDQ